MKNNDGAVSMTKMETVLRNAVLGKLCASYWLGHANVLILGIGPEVLARPVMVKDRKGRSRFRHGAAAPFALQSRFADWRIERAGILLGHSENDATCETAAASLSGQAILDSKITNPGFGLEVTFDDALVLAITPYEPGSSDYVWSLREPRGMVYFVRSNGQIVLRSESAPYE